MEDSTGGNVSLALAIGIPVAIVIATPLLIKLYIVLTRGHYEIIEDLRGKTYIVTGANAGIGKATATALAAKGARVILACRNVSKAEEAKKEIVQKTGSQSVVIIKLDLCSFKSVREFCDKVLESENQLDCIICNAGLLTPSKLEKTADGFETSVQANYLGHFLLVNLLMDLLRTSAPSRVVILSSAGIWFTSGPVDNLELHPVLFPFINYAKTKVLATLFTVELARKLEGTGVTANCCHPGLVRTDSVKASGGAQQFFLKLNMTAFGRSCEQGAMTSLFLATSDKVANISGRYFAECKTALCPPWAKNPDKARRLWETSEKAVDLSKIDLDTSDIRS